MKILFTTAIILAGFVSRTQTLVIHFDFNKADLNEISRSSIDSFLETKKNKLAGTTIKITGHCDAIGSTGYNDKLSLRRIETVKKYLEDNYLDSGMISTLNAYGERKPLNKNKTEKDRLENRRVEITVMQKQSAQMSGPKQKSLREKLTDTTTKAGSRLVLRNINFFFGTHRFIPDAHQPLQELLDAMKSFPNMIIEVHGHICCSPTTDDGYDIDTRTNDLSLQRAIAVMKFLVENGIDSRRVSVRGIGHFNPIYPFPEKNEYERQENRRVEIQIIKK